MAIIVPQGSADQGEWLPPRACRISAQASSTTAPIATRTNASVNGCTCSLTPLVTTKVLPQITIVTSSMTMEAR